MAEPRTPGTVLSAQDARKLHASVKARYVAVAHTLSDRQRRVQRMYLAQLTAMAKRAHQDEWARLQSTPLLVHTQARSAVQFNIAKARMASLAISASLHGDAALAIADAVDTDILSSLQQSVAAVSSAPVAPASPSADLRARADQAKQTIAGIRDTYIASVKGASSDSKEAKIAALKASLQ